MTAPHQIPTWQLDLWEYILELLKCFHLNWSRKWDSASCMDILFERKLIHHLYSNCGTCSRVNGKLTKFGEKGRNANHLIYVIELHVYLLNLHPSISNRPARDHAVLQLSWNGFIDIISIILTCSPVQKQDFKLR